MEYPKEALAILSKGKIYEIIDWYREFSTTVEVIDRHWGINNEGILLKVVYLPKN